MRYNTIDVNLWSDPWVVEHLEEPYAKLLFAYLITCSHVEQDGVAELTPRTIANETGMPVADVRRLLPTLAPKILWWPQSFHVFVVNHFTYNRGGNWQWDKKAAKCAASRPADVRAAIVERHPSLADPHAIGPRKQIIDEPDPPSHRESIRNGLGIESEWIGNRIGIESESILSNSNSTSNSTSNTDTPEARATTKAPKEIYSEPFSRWWAIYPRKDDKGAAFKAWRTLGLDGEADTVIAGVMPYLDCAQWRKENGQFIPLGGTFLNRRQWEGSPVVTLPPSNVKPKLAY